MMQCSCERQTLPFCRVRPQADHAHSAAHGKEREGGALAMCTLSTDELAVRLVAHHDQVCVDAAAVELRVAAYSWL